MAPKKDDKKGKKEGHATLKEIDLNHYVRKIKALPDVNPEEFIPITRSQGKIAFVDHILPIWNEDAAEIINEPWNEPHAPEKLSYIKYPACLNIEKSVPITQYFKLEPSEPVDPKAAKKKETAKKPPAKGAKDEIIEMTEVLVSEAGVTLPVVYRGDDFLTIPEELRPFATTPLTTAADTSILDDNDPYICETFRLVTRLFPLTGSVSPSSYLWRSIYPQTAAGKPVYNPSGRYILKLFISSHWRRVAVDDSIPVTADGQCAVAMSDDHMELWPLLLAKGLYAAYSALHLRFLDEPEFSTPSVAIPNTAAGGSKGVPSLFFTQGLSTSDRLSCFLLFSLHTLTGWAPHTSADFTRLLQEDGSSKVCKLLDSMVTAGTPLIVDKEKRLDNDDDDDASYRLLITSNEEAKVKVDAEPLMQEAAVEEEMAFKTKRKFKEQYAMREAQRSAIISAILSREQRLTHTHTILTEPDTTATQRSELFLLLKYDQRVERYRVWPVLALAASDDSNNNNNSSSNSGFFSSLASSASSTAVNKDHLLAQTKLLLTWRKFPPVPTLPTSTDPVLLGQGKYKVGSLQDPFPMASPVTRQWLSLQQLLPSDDSSVSQQVLLMGLFTGQQTIYKAHFNRSWQPLDAVLQAQQVTAKELLVDPKDVNKKKTPVPAAADKGKKDTASTTTDSDDQTVCADPGPPAPTLLSIDMTLIAAPTLNEMNRLMDEQLAQLQSQQNKEEEEEELLLEEEVEADEEGNEEEEEEREAILEQQQRLHELSQSSSTPPDQKSRPENSKAVQFMNIDGPPRIPCLTITVTIQVDMLKLQQSTAEAEAEAEAEADTTATEGNGKGLMMINPTGSFIAASSEQVQPLLSSSTSATRQSWDNATSYNQKGLQPPRKVILPSDTVLVLQEVRLDDQIPLMGVLELKDYAHLPIISKSFTFPLPKGYSLNEDGTAPKLDFWLRLFSKCSVTVQLMANAPIKVDLAERIWAMNEEGRGVFVAEGESMATVQGVETLLFRLPLLIAPSATATTAVEDTAPQPSQEEQQLQQERALVFLHLPERPVERLTQLMLGQLQGHNRFISIEEVGQGGGVQGVLVPLTQDNNGSGDFRSLLAVTFPPEPDPYTLQVKDQPPQQVPPFKWKLVVLSNQPLLPPLSSTRPSLAEVPSGQRLTGGYIPNNQLKLFRDVLTFDKAAAAAVIVPMAFRLTVHPVIDPAAAVEGDEQVHNVEPFQANFDDNNNDQAADEDLDIAVIVSLYRKHDLKLVAEYRGGRTLHCYYQDLSAFLPDPDDNRSASATALAVSGKKEEKPSTKKGKEEVKVEGIDVIMDCRLDSNAMMTIPPRFHSRYPHAFDAYSNEEMIKSQSQLLRESPPTKPLLVWTLDILAGKLLNVAHDTTLLLQQQAVKKSWLAEDAARIDKAQAAAGYVLERDHLVHHHTNSHSQAVLLQQLSHSPSHESKEQQADHPAAAAAAQPQHEVVLSASLLEHLVTALDVDLEEIKARFTTLLSLPHIDEAVELVPDHPHAAPQESLINPYKADRPIGSEAWSAAVQSRRGAEAQAHEQHYQHLISRAAELSVSYREQCAARLTVLNEQIHAQRSAALHTVTGPREKLRLEAEVKNSALSFLLKRANDAKTAAASSEAAAEAERLKQEAKNAKNKKK